MSRIVQSICHMPEPYSMQYISYRMPRTAHCIWRTPYRASHIACGRSRETHDGSHITLRIPHSEKCARLIALAHLAQGTSRRPHRIHCVYHTASIVYTTLHPSCIPHRAPHLIHRVYHIAYHTASRASRIAFLITHIPAPHFHTSWFSSPPP